MTVSNQASGGTVYDALGRHPVHPFPARMAPCVAIDILSTERRGLRVLDPMMGSGTVLALARSKGHRAIGCDLDPLAVLIAKVWTTSIDPSVVREAACQVSRRAFDIFRTTTTAEAYPSGADPETCKFVRFWFDPYARRQLASLAQAIGKIRPGPIQNLLWCVFSRLIITKQAGASLAMDLAHSRPHKVYKTAPVKPFSRFSSAVERVVQNCVTTSTACRGPVARSFEGDARKLPLRDRSIDIVLTSPPYLNAIDYLRCSKFSLVWMGHDLRMLRELRSSSVGTEVGKKDVNSTVRAIIDRLHLSPALSQRSEAILARYIDDMHVALGEVARVLNTSGKAVYVVGENTIRGTYIPNATIVSEVAATAGLALHSKKSRTLPTNRRYLPPPSESGAANLDTRMRREVVLTFTHRK